MTEKNIQPSGQRELLEKAEQLTRQTAEGKELSNGDRVFACYHL